MRISTENTDFASETFYASLRASGCLPIFVDQDDFKNVLQAALRGRNLLEVSIYAFCIVPTGLHMVVHGEHDAVVQYLRSIKNEYRRYFNAKNSEIRQVFRKSFLSYPLSDTPHIIDTIRYIWRIPLIEGLTQDINAFQWSSYRLLKRHNALIDSAALGSFMSSSDWQLFACSPCAYWHTSTPKSAPPLQATQNRLCELAGVECIQELRQLPAYDIAYICKKALSERFSQTQISKALGISRYALKKLLDGPCTPALNRSL